MTEHEIVNFLNQQYKKTNMDFREYSIHDIIKDPDGELFFKDLLFYSTIKDIKNKRPELLDRPLRHITESDLVAINMSATQHLNNMLNIINLNSKE